MKKLILIIFALLICQVGILLATTKNSSAAAFKFGLTLFMTSTIGGNYMIFDRSDGKIYIYDQNLNQCIFQYQIEELGKPLSPLH